MTATVSGCRFCEHPLTHTFVDLGMSPLANSYIQAHQYNKMEPFYPLHVYICENCLLVQLEEFEKASNIFSDYAYFSSYSDSWLQHAQRYVDMMAERFAFGTQSQVIEIASNDGYLLQYFQAKGVPVIGIEPASNIAKVASKKGIPTIEKFFNIETARELVAQGKQADLLIGNNVLAHVPALNDFVAGIKIVLKPHGIVTMEFPYILRLIDEQQFDTIYHEHFSYFSFYTVERIFAKHGLTLFDVEEVTTHGGSLRIFGRHAEDAGFTVSENVHSLKRMEAREGLQALPKYLSFVKAVRETKCQILEFLITAKREGKTVVSYGAPAKGNTLLNFCGVGKDFIDYTVDRSPQKQGCLLPGTHIPIFHPDKITETKPDYVLILPWNIKDEVMSQMKHIRDWGGQFVTPIPEVKVYP
ncbi:MAG: methyltransferase [Nitrospirales bacterium]|nr:MAG: methyltransferase [Nitrospirales bacterium]